MKEYLTKKLNLLQKRLEEVQKDLDYLAVPTASGFKYVDENKATKNTGKVSYLLHKRSKIKRKIRKTNKALASA